MVRAASAHRVDLISTFYLNTQPCRSALLSLAPGSKCQGRIWIFQPWGSGGGGASRHYSGAKIPRSTRQVVNGQTKRDETTRVGQVIKSFFIISFRGQKFSRILASVCLSGVIQRWAFLCENLRLEPRRNFFNACRVKLWLHATKFQKGEKFQRRRYVLTFVRLMLKVELSAYGGGLTRKAVRRRKPRILRQIF